MERKNEHQGETKDPRKITAEFGGTTKIIKEKTHQKTTDLKNERESEKERSMA